MKKLSEKTAKRLLANVSTSLAKAGLKPPFTIREAVELEKFMGEQTEQTRGEWENGYDAFNNKPNEDKVDHLHNIEDEAFLSGSRARSQYNSKDPEGDMESFIRHSYEAYGGEFDFTRLFVERLKQAWMRGYSREIEYPSRG